MRTDLLRRLGEMLSRGSISQWRLMRELRSDEERYCAKQRVETNRRVMREIYQVEITREHSPSSQGLALIRLAPGTSRWEERLEDLVKMAHNHNHPFQFPGEQTLPVDDRHCHDPALASNLGNAADQIVGEWLGRSFGDERPGHFAARVWESNLEVQSSRGLDVRARSTGLSLEGSLTTSEHERSFERRASFLSSAGLHELLELCSRELRLIPSATLPKTGRYAVLLHRGAVAQLFRAAAHDLSALAVLRGTSRLQVGGSFCAPEVSIYVNSPVPGLGQCAVDEEGQPVAECLAVERGVVRQLVASHRYAALTGVPCTGGMTNLRVEGGSYDLETLLAAAAGPVLEVVAFSNFVPDRTTKSFAGEVRLGFLHDGPARRPVRGGSISGDVCVALSGALLSKAAGVDFGNVAASDLPCHVADYALLQPHGYAGA